jgi:hypothetical protein
MRDANYGAGSPNDGSGNEAATNEAQSPQYRVCTDGGANPDNWTPTGEVPTFGGVDDLTLRQYVEAVHDGFTTQTEVGDAMGVNRSTAARNLNPLADRDDAPIRKGRQGNGVVYQYDPSAVTADDGTSTTDGDGDDGGDGDGGNGSGSTDDGMFPKPRDAYPANTPDFRHTWNFDERAPGDGGIPHGVAEYHPSGYEYDDLRMLTNNPDAFEGAPVMNLVGPTGAGKTHAPKFLADQMGARYFEVTISESMDPVDLKGYRDLRPEGSVWIDGPIVEALQSSQEAFTVLVVDEANRGHQEVISTLMETLDDRCQITLESRGGETVKGDPDNLMVVFAMNPGDDPDYDTTDMGIAQLRRQKYQHEVDYLGRQHPDREASILTERVGVSQEWADAAVEAANAIRDLADTEVGNSFGQSNGGNNGNNGVDEQKARAVTRGTPTGTLIDLANKAKLHAGAGHPSHNARAISTTLRLVHSDDGVTVAQERFKDKLGDIDPEGGA